MAPYQPLDANGAFVLPPKCYGMEFTKAHHSKPEGITDPLNNPQPKGFIVCITGAGKGIGKHIALAYAKAGVAGIVICSRTQSDLDQVSSEIKTINSKVEVLWQTCDTTKGTDIDRLLTAIKQKFSRLDVCVANAGVYAKLMPDGSLPGNIASEIDFDWVIEVNFIATARLAQKFVPFLLESKGAKTFIAITSIGASAENSSVAAVSYNTSKRALCHLVESIANDHYKDGLLAYSVHPGSTVTDMTRNLTKEKGDLWDLFLQDDVALAGGFLTWLTKEKREWLNGRYISANWDAEDLATKKDEIVEDDKLKWKMVV